MKLFHVRKWHNISAAVDLQITARSDLTELCRVDTELTTVTIIEDLLTMDPAVSVVSPTTPVAELVIESALIGKASTLPTTPEMALIALLATDSTVSTACPGRLAILLVTPLMVTVALSGAARTWEPKLREAMAMVRNCML